MHRIFQIMRNWNEDHTYGLNLLSFVRGRGEVACLLYDIVLKKGLPTSNAWKWNESERKLVETMAYTVL